MMLWTFFLPSLLAVAFLGWLALRLYGPNRENILSEEAARVAFQQDFFDDGVDAVLLDAPRRHALLLLDDQEAAGLVLVFGDKLVTRRLGKDLLNTIEIDGKRWHLGLDDLVLPSVTLIFDENTTGSAVADELRGRLEEIAAPG
ncbi:MAG: hypothetical protein D6757_05245 [Alphaproteobacteria bacterium]|nr:MAG: hypothetical protein D6757_05245 [Alphaproteobacteria bacterium]